MCTIPKPANRFEAKQNSRRLIWFYAGIVLVSQLLFFCVLATMSDWPERVSSALHSSMHRGQQVDKPTAVKQRLRSRIKQVVRSAEEKLLDLECGVNSSGKSPVSRHFQGNSLRLNDVARGSVGAGRYQLYHMCVVNRPKDSHETAQVQLRLAPREGNVDLLVSFDNPRPSLQSFAVASKHPGTAEDELLLDSSTPDWPLTDMVHVYISVVGGKGGGSYTLHASTKVRRVE